MTGNIADTYNEIWNYLDSIDGNNPDRKSPFNIGNTVVHRNPAVWESERYGPMIVLEFTMLDLIDERWEESESPDYRFCYTLLAGDEKIVRFEERLKLYTDT